jgi:hypothetical protein
MEDVMDSNQSNKYSMYISTVELLRDNAARGAGIQAFGTSFAKLDALVTQIRDKDKERMGKTPGKVAAKDGAEDALSASVVLIAAALAGLGKTTGNAELKHRAHLTDSAFRNARSTEQVSIANLIYDLGKTNQEALAAFGVSPALIEELKSRIAAYDAALKDIASGTAERVGARSALAELFEKADELLKEELDPVMHIFRVADPDFYGDYKAARVIKDIGVRHVKTPEGAGVAVAAGSPS